MKKNGKKQGWPGHLFVILASMVLLTSWALCGTYAKYVSTATGSSMARVAKFEVRPRWMGTGNRDRSPDRTGRKALL